MFASSIGSSISRAAPFLATLAATAAAQDSTARGPAARVSSELARRSGRVQVDVKTDNYIAPISIGAQLGWPTGAFRPCVNAGVGGQALFTEGRLEGAGDHTAFASTTNHSYHNGGRARYLVPGSITDLSGAQPSVSPLESATHLLIVRVGARISR